MRMILYPLSLLYSIVLYVRHKLFDLGIIKSKSFDVPVICIGNLSFGGTGKTPHIEYLIRLLSPRMNVAVLSRGYGRKTKGFLLAKDGMTHDDIGDEPLQYSRKFNDITVAVDENRVEGVSKLLEMDKKPDVILLDDAYQHRHINPGFNILLTDYHNIYGHDHLTPSGNLRDIKYAARRANLIVVTKCPIVLDPYSKKNIIDSLKPKSYQKILFSQIHFDKITPVNDAARKVDISKNRSVFLFCGIANPYPLEDYLKRNVSTVFTMYFSDHHSFTEKDIDQIIDGYRQMIGNSKIALTTEKDVMRIIHSDIIKRFNDIPLFTIPITICFPEDYESIFNKSIIDYVGV